MAQQDAKARQTQHLPSQARSPIGTLRYFPLPWRTKGRRLTTRYAMEQIVNLHIERLPEGVYLATSDDIPGLAAQGRTATETLEIARNVAKKLLESTRNARGYPSSRKRRTRSTIRWW